MKSPKQNNTNLVKKMHSNHIKVFLSHRVMKGKWIRPQDYACADTLFYATNRALAAIGVSLSINYNHNAA